MFALATFLTITLAPSFILGLELPFNITECYDENRLCMGISNTSVTSFGLDGGCIEYSTCRASLLASRSEDDGIIEWTIIIQSNGRKIRTYIDLTTENNTVNSYSKTFVSHETGFLKKLPNSYFNHKLDGLFLVIDYITNDTDIVIEKYIISLLLVDFEIQILKFAEVKTTIPCHLFGKKNFANFCHENMKSKFDTSISINGTDEKPINDTDIRVSKKPKSGRYQNVVIVIMIAIILLLIFILILICIWYTFSKEKRERKESDERMHHFITTSGSSATNEESTISSTKNPQSSTFVN